MLLNVDVAAWLVGPYTFNLNKSGLFSTKSLDIFVLKFTYLVNSCSWYLWLLSVNKSLEFSALCDSWQTELKHDWKLYLFSASSLSIRFHSLLTRASCSCSNVFSRSIFSRLNCIRQVLFVWRVRKFLTLQTSFHTNILFKFKVSVQIGFDAELEL